MSVTQTVSEFISKTSYDDIPRQAVELAKKHILDCIGVALAGSQSDAAKIVTGYAKASEAKPECGVIAAGFKTCRAEAALVNGTLSHILDYDDVVMSSLLHPSAPVLPAILAMAEKAKTSGKNILEAFIIGVEVETQIAKGLGLKYYDIGWHATSVVGTLGATAGAAKLARLDSRQIQMALGIAASQACGLRANFGSMTKPLHAGIAARNGVVATLLAQAGFTADESILETPVGFVKVFGHGEDDVALIVKELGNPFNITQPGFAIKHYPSCSATHPCIKAVLQIAKKHKVKVDDVDEVICHSSYRTPRICIHQRPKTPLEGKFSMQYCMAVALVDGVVGMQQFADEAFERPKVQQLLRKVKYATTKEPWGKETPAEAVTLRLKDGTEYRQEVRYQPGGSPNPLSIEQVCSKYRECASKVLFQNSIGIPRKPSSPLPSG